MHGYHYSMCFWVDEFRKLYYPDNAQIAMDMFEREWEEEFHVRNRRPHSISFQYIGGPGFFEVIAESYTMCCEARRIIVGVSKKVYEAQEKKAGWM